jgi:uncharacterized membrane protein
MSRFELRVVTLLVCLFACGYAVFGLFQHWSFGTSFDLGIFDQAIWHLSRFESFASSIRGYSNLLGDHFHPILGLFAPLYWMAPAPETLIVGQALLLAASIVPVFVFVRSRLPSGPALALSGAYGCFWGLQQTAASDFHEVAFAPLLLATAILAMDRRNWTLLWTVCVLLMCVKEDLIPVVMFLGLYLAVNGERKRGVLLAASSLVAFAVIVGYVIPSLGSSGTYTYGGAYAEILKTPWLIPVELVTPTYKLRTIVLWFAPFLLMSLRSPLSLLLVPLALERFLSDSPTHWGTAFHYSAPVAPIVAMSAGDGLARLAHHLDPTRARRLVVGVSAASVVLSSILPGRQPLWRLLSPRHYQTTASERVGYQALALIPRDATVTAQGALLPHLSQRDEIYILEPGVPVPATEFIVASASVSPWPFDAYEGIAVMLDERRIAGYAVVFEEGGWILLRRSPPP